MKTGPLVAICFGVGMGIGSAGTLTYRHITNTNAPTDLMELIYVRPLASVATKEEPDTAQLSLVVEYDGKPLMCYTDKKISASIVQEANRYVIEEINDGDKESIRVMGTYTGNQNDGYQFKLGSLTAKGQQFIFKE